MQIHELNSFAGTPGTGDYLAIDDGTETFKVPAKSVYEAMTQSEVSTGTGTTPKVITPAVLKAAITQLVKSLTGEIVTGSTTDTTQSGWIILKYNGSNLLASQYDVISAGCDGSGRLIIPFVSGGIWYAEIATYTGGTLKSIADTTVTVSYTLRKKA